MRSMVTPAQVDRGTAHIILIGEKGMDSTHYNDGEDSGDNETLYVGQDNDLYRTTSGLPHMDAPGLYTPAIFGSAHPGGCNFVFGDGSVHTVPYDPNDPVAFEVIFLAWGIRNSLDVTPLTDD